MDVARPPEVARQRKRRRIMAALAMALFVIITTVARARLKPAAPSVDAAPLWIDAVKRGTMLRNVRGVGVLIPDDIRWITALTEGRVERVLVQPGTTVTPDTVLLELSNPQTEQAALTAELDVKGALVQFDILKVDLRRDLLEQRAAAMNVAAEAAQAAMDAEANDAMAKQGLVSAIVAKQARLRAETAASRKKVEDERLANTEESLTARLA